MILTKIQHNKFNKKQLAAFAGFLLAFFYLPVIGLWSGIIPFHFRFIVTFGAVIGMISYTRVRKLDWSCLGFRRDTLKRSLLWNLGVSLLFLAVLYGLHSTGLIVKDAARFLPVFYIFYFLVLSPVQEFFFRSILFAELRMVSPGSPWFIIMLSSLSFCFLHVIYRCPFTMFVTLLMGIVWGVIYYRYPNFWGVTFSHALLGAAAIAVGLI